MWDDYGEDGRKSAAIGEVVEELERCIDCDHANTAVDL